MTENEIFTKITTIIEDHFDVSADKVTEQTNFKTDLDADSIDLVEFVLELEDAFGAEISDEDAEQIVTVKDAVDYIASHQGYNYVMPAVTKLVFFAIMDNALIK